MAPMHKQLTATVPPHSRVSGPKGQFCSGDPVSPKSKDTVLLGSNDMARRCSMIREVVMYRAVPKSWKVLMAWGGAQLESLGTCPSSRRVLPSLGTVLQPRTLGLFTFMHSACQCVLQRSAVRVQRASSFRTIETVILQDPIFLSDGCPPVSAISAISACALATQPLGVDVYFFFCFSL